VLKINTLISAYNLGKEIRETVEGKEIYERVTNLKKHLSLEAWSAYNSLIFSCETDHYYTFDLAYKKIEYAAANGISNYKKVFQELKSDSELHKVIEQSRQMAIDIEDLFRKITAGPIPNQISNQYNSSRLHRTILNLFYHLHSTKFLYYIQKLHKSISDEYRKKLLEYSELKVPVPLAKHNRVLINKLSKDKKTKENLYFTEIFDSIKKYVLQLIFETHFNFNVSVYENNIVWYKEKELNKIRIFKSSITGVGNITKGNFVLYFKEKRLKEVGLIFSKIIKNLEDDKIRSNIIKGMLYPIEDENLFIP
jgi:hypothetical protein